jgi:hypothetical protein
MKFTYQSEFEKDLKRLLKRYLTQWAKFNHSAH